MGSLGDRVSGDGSVVAVVTMKRRSWPWQRRVTKEGAHMRFWRKGWHLLRKQLEEQPERWPGNQGVEGPRAPGRECVEKKDMVNHVTCFCK